MRLKKLDLQGYKTFASRTEFAFDAGITAIVGPNGSGKSNVADAIRWVLGEQSFRLLRAKKTEDMIFAGSQKRARAGMAQATMVLDNSDGQLPVEFSDVAIGRRAYRSGENEYLLNGSRVRLRDTSDLLAASGLGQRTYSVIGQGLVDAALSLRAEERRALFEEAAGIALYKERREEALGRLEATRRNLERVEDILSEILPRMRQLERQAIRSREYAQVNADLENLLYLWYGYHWDLAKNELRQARSEAAAQSAVLADLRTQQTALDEQLAALRHESQQLRASLGDWHRQNSQLHQQAEGVQRNLAVHAERMRLLGQQQGELEGELSSLDGQRQRSAGRLNRAVGLLNESADRWKEQQAAVSRARAALDQGRGEVDRLRSQERQMQREGVRLESRAAALQEQREESARTQQRLAAAQETARDALAQQLLGRAAAEARLAGHQEELAACEASLADLEQARAGLQAQHRSMRAGLAAARQEQDKAVAASAELEARRRAVHELRERGAGHDAAVRQLLEAADRPAGIVAPVIQLLEVPAERERAVAAALGANVSALVVSDWQAAQRVLAHPAVVRAQVTLFPLEGIRPCSPITPPDDPDAIGVAAGMAACLPEHRHVVDALLGQVLLVRDREAARRLAALLPAGSCAVDPDGLMVHQDGRVVKPGEETGRGLLAQERLWRSLPEQTESARRALQDAEADVAAGERSLSQVEASREQIERQLQEAHRAAQAILRLQEAARLDLGQLSQSVAWNEEQLEEIGRRSAALVDEATTLDGDATMARQHHALLQRELEQVQVQLAATSLEALAAQLSDCERALAQTEGGRLNQQALVETHRRALQQVEAQVTARRRRAEETARERELLAAQMAIERQQAERLAEQIEDATRCIGPAEEQLAAVEAGLESLSADEEQLRRRVRGAEQVENRLQLTLDRRETHLDHLRGRVQEELGLVNLPLDEDIPGQTPLPLGDMVGQLPAVRALPEGLEDSIQRRKQQLKRMGPINPTAPAEFGELERRYTFLKEQMQDLNETDAKLRQVVTELDTVMERQFKATFQEVAAEFKEAFTRLFGGGSARLILTDPDNPIQSGVEVIARPPGRRQQGLALLSGGERSLAAAALIFSLLRVSPTPFCVLDEVDAMLDEANVGRFREMLVDLSNRTQFIVITHNWGTVQAADTVYGVSMGEDGTSQVVSLRLEGDRLRND